jgi:DinB family protein
MTALGVVRVFLLFYRYHTRPPPDSRYTRPMDAIDFFLVRYEQIHGVLSDPAIKQLTAAQMRARPHPGVNTIAWLLWHMARVEDVGVNRFVADRPQVLEDGWLARLGVARRDVGTGMSDAEVDDFSLRIDLDALRGYWDAVTRRTAEVVATLRSSDLEAVVPKERVERVALAESAVAPGAEWLTEFWAGGRTRAWVLAQTPLLHVYGHYSEARVVAGLWGARSL